MHSHKNTNQNCKRLFPAVLLGLVVASAATAQSIPFTMTYTQGAATTALPNAGTLALAASLGNAQTLQVRAVYTGTGTITIPHQPSVTGSGAFSATLNQALPVTLNPNEAIVFTVRFAPLFAAADAAQLTIPFAETPSSTTAPIALALQGFTAAIVPSYTSPDDNNVVQLSSGSTIPFPDTLVGQSSPVTLGFTNIGSAVGQVTKVSATGSAFQLQNLPLFPATITGGQTLQMKIVYKPTAAGPSTGTLTLELGGASPVVIQLSGNAITPKLTYELGNPPAAIVPGATITLPSVEVGQNSTSLVRVTNTGSAPTVISTISTVGANYSVANAPILPQTLAPNGSLVFGVNFVPAKTGAQTGTLIVNSDVFNLSGSGLGPLLSFSYVASGTTVNLGGGNNSVIFSPVRITESAQLNFDIKNTGTTIATIQNIGVGQTGTAFSILNPPALPASLAPNATLRVSIKFEPTVVGFASTTLVVDTNSFTLTGSGTAPPALPAYTLSGPTGTTAPLTQPSVGLKLAAPYPVAITGTLTLATTAASLPPDPSVQFATGGRTVTFRIPANTVDATFGSLGTQIGLQTGTVASTTTVTPAFATVAGNVDLTPAAPVTSQFTVVPAAPAILSVQVLNPTTKGFSLQVTGFTTTRTLTGLNVQLTTASGFKMPTSQFAIDTKLVAAAWFQSIASQAFGGQFRVTVPFTFALPADQSILTGITSATVTAANESGDFLALNDPDSIATLEQSRIG